MASITATAAMLTISRTSSPVCRTWIGAPIPSRIGPIALASAQAGQQLVGDIGRFERGEDQHVGILHLAERIALVDDLRHDRRIGLHLAVHREVGSSALGSVPPPCAPSRRAGAGWCRSSRRTARRPAAPDLSLRAKSAARQAISARSSALGSMLTVASVNR